MLRTAPLCSLLLLALTGWPSSPAQAQGAWVKAAPWEQDFAKAKAKALKGKRVILAYFGKPGCPACRQVQEGPLAEQGFAGRMKKAVLYTSIGRDARELKRLGGEVQPYLVFLDPQGKVLAPYLGRLKAISIQRALHYAGRLLALRDTKQPDPLTRFQLFEARVELWLIEPAAARKRLQALIKLPKARLSSIQRWCLERAIDDTEILRLWFQLQPRTKEARAKLAERYRQAFQRGCRPRRPSAVQAFYVLVFEAAERSQDRQTYRQAIEGLRAWLKKNGGKPASAEAYQKRFQRLFPGNPAPGKPAPGKPAQR